MEDRKAELQQALISVLTEKVDGTFRFTAEEVADVLQLAVVLEAMAHPSTLSAEESRMVSDLFRRIGLTPADAPEKIAQSVLAHYAAHPPRPDLVAAFMDALRTLAAHRSAPSSTAAKRLLGIESSLMPLAAAKRGDGSIRGGALGRMQAMISKPKP